jgi:hypothetical protein
MMGHEAHPHRVWLRTAVELGLSTGAEVVVGRRSLTCDSTFDNRLAVYEGNDCVGPIVACSDDACGVDMTRAEVMFPVIAGEEYLVRIGSFRAGGGEGVLVLPCSQ